MPRPLLAFALSTLLSACAAERAIAPTTGGATTSELLCLGDGDFDFSLRAGALERWEGAEVRTVAFEPSLLGVQAQAPRRPVDLRGRVVGGRFSAGCPMALKNNSSYPSVALFVDVDGDGRCGPGDVGTIDQRYAWSATFGDQSFAYFDGVDHDSSAWGRVDGQGPPIGAPAGSSFCSGYFE